MIMTKLEMKIMALETKILHRMWTFVDTSNPHTLLNLSDQELIQRIIGQVESISPLSSEDISLLSRYIAARTMLIRDLAYSKVSIGYGM